MNCVFPHAVDWRTLAEADRYRRVISLAENATTRAIEYIFDRELYYKETGVQFDESDDFGATAGCLTIVLPSLAKHCVVSAHGTFASITLWHKDSYDSDKQAEAADFTKFIVEFEQFCEQQIAAMDIGKQAQPVPYLLSKHTRSIHESVQVVVVASMSHDKKQANIARFDACAANVKKITLDNAGNAQFDVCMKATSDSIPMSAIDNDRVFGAPQWKTLIRLNPIELDRVRQCFCSKWQCVGYYDGKQDGEEADEKELLFD